ncbi:MAG: hypothetical protein ABI325_07035 [Ginsengibacter sp.]
MKRRICLILPQCFRLLDGKHFFDVRRWVIGSEAYTNATKVTVVYLLNPDHTTATIPAITPQLLEKRSWNDKYTSQHIYMI